MTVGDVAADRRRIDEALKWTVSSLADDVEEVAVGWLARSRELPLVHSLNRVQIKAALDPEEVIAMADDHQGDLPYRHIEVDDQATAASLEAALAEPGSGWKVDREVFMVLAERPSGAESGGAHAADRPLATPDILTQAETDELMRQWLVEDGFTSPVGALDQLSECNLREGALWNEDVLGVRESGPVAMTKSRALAGVGWVEDVYTLPVARRKGYARLLVGRAIELARAGTTELTFIIADDNDWPKHLYAELGFRPIGYTWTFHRELPG
jgi:GNAT superfamily N-acetyltransferase